MQNTKIEYSDAELKFLEFIQNIITRMNTNSFFIKQIAIAIVSAILAMFVSTKHINTLIVSLLPIIAFCLLDSYYLWQERKFRKLYNKAFKHEIKLFDMNTNNIKESYTEVLFSKTILPFYCGLILLNIIIGFCSEKSIF